LPDLEGIDQIQGLRNVESIDLYRKLLIKFRERYQNFLEEFRLEQQSQDPTAATRYAHSLKGVAAILGITSVQETALSLELTCKDLENSLKDAALTKLIETCVQAVQRSLEPILVVLEGVQESTLAVSPNLDPAASLASLETLRSELRRLEALLQEDNAESLTVMETIESLLPRCSLSADALGQIKAIQIAIEVYEFEQALDRLRSLVMD